MNRTGFFAKIVNDGIEEHDHLHNNLSRFTMLYPVFYYRVQQDDLMRPDLISYKNYGTVGYWWIICYVNGIQNPFTDLEVGKLLTLPNVLDLYTFYKKYRMS